MSDAPSPDDDPERRAFAAHCASWLAAHTPEPPPFALPATPLEVQTEQQLEWLRAWQRACWQAELVGCDVPREYGGHGRRGLQATATRALAARGAPFLVNLVALQMACPTILAHGSDAQKRRFVPGCLSADEIWCQGFSEPNAGSDLANVQARATLRDGVWRVDGHKVWTTLARFADWMILLARTEPDAQKHAGLTYFLCPIKGQRGVTVRPLVKLTGELGFNEVLFDDVELADELRLDERGRGWQVAMTTLLHERGAADSAGGGLAVPAAQLDALVALARRVERGGRPAIEDPWVRDRIVSLMITARGLAANAERAREPALCDHPLRLPLQAKVLTTEWAQALAHLGMELQGAAGALSAADPSAGDGGAWPRAYLGSYGMTIAAGTSEIQRNILAERVLELPRHR
ncbi:MAG: acyl-CoA dehydrogenase family protein [Polyangiaceae bacterium]|nr:acyl-CoA dehydrogenase family protein [Polyangiaceae bacterium]